MFFVYVDFTDDDRPFYVGKGTADRVKRARRNRHHRGVAAKHGCRREVVLETPDEFEAFNREIRLIAELHTFVGDPLWNGVGANHTMGGEGATGAVISEERRQKLSVLNRGHKRPDASARRKGVPLSQETKEKISLAQRGRRLPPRSKAHCEAIAAVRIGRKRAPFSHEARARMSEAHRGKKLTAEHRANIAAAKRGKKRVTTGHRAMQRVIIIEGPDRCGKTEIAQALASDLSIPYWKVDREWSAFKGDPAYFRNTVRYGDSYLLSYLRSTGASVVKDRGYPSEWVYARAMGRDRDDESLWHVDSQYADLGAVVVLCGRSSYAGIADDRFPDDLGSEKLAKIDGLYREFARTTRCRVVRLNVDDCDLARELRELRTALA